MFSDEVEDWDSEDNGIDCKYFKVIYRQILRYSLLYIQQPIQT
jgi:hypothetical protein